MDASRHTAYLVLVLCLGFQTHAISVDEHPAEEVGPHELAHDEAMEEHVETVFGGPGDLGEAAVTVDHEPNRRTVTFQYKHESSNDLGESRKSTQKGAYSRAHKLFEFGELLGKLPSEHSMPHGHAVRSLNGAIHAKLLLDELQPKAGSFTKKSNDARLGEARGVHKLPSFKTLLHTKKRNMAHITQYLLERKKQGDPLSTREDAELQKFYYNRASTILKKIVLLKRGRSHLVHNPQTTEKVRRTDDKVTAGPSTVKAASEHADVVIARLKFDAKVANANADYNRKMMQAQKSHMEAAEKERQQALKQALAITREKLEMDKKVAKVQNRYDHSLALELLRKKNKAEVKVRKASEEKRDADKAATKASAEARKADKEAAEAEEEARKATEHARELENEEERNNRHAHGKPKPKIDIPKPKINIPLSVAPRVHLDALLRYLRSAVTKHLKITPQETQLMQSFFLRHGSAMLSKLAQVDPDATWHSKGVVREEQYEMEHNRPDQLSEEWGSRKLSGDTVVGDFMADVLSRKKSHVGLLPPSDGKEHAIRLFDSDHRVPLHYLHARSNLHKKTEIKEPSMDLGESSDEEQEADKQTPTEHAWVGLMGIN